MTRGQAVAMAVNQLTGSQAQQAENRACATEPPLHWVLIPVELIPTRGSGGRRISHGNLYAWGISS